MGPKCQTIARPITELCTNTGLSENDTGHFSCLHGTYKKVMTLLLGPLDDPGFGTPGNISVIFSISVIFPVNRVPQRPRPRHDVLQRRLIVVSSLSLVSLHVSLSLSLYDVIRSPEPLVPQSEANRVCPKSNSFFST